MDWYYCTRMKNSWIVESENQGLRLATFVKKKVSDLKGSDIEWCIEHNQCLVNGKLERFLSRKLKSNDRVCLTLNKKPTFAFEKSRILFEDDFLLAYDKPQSIATESLKEIIPYPFVHRLDRDTTGVLLFAKQGQKLFEELFRKRQIVKNYLALVYGIPGEKRGVIEQKLIKVSQKNGVVTWGLSKKGIYAKTEWFLEKAFEKTALLRCIPYTGRTHQIRIHLSSIGHPIVGDCQYGKKEAQKMNLRAISVEFIHPFTKLPLKIQAPSE